MLNAVIRPKSNSAFLRFVLWADGIYEVMCGVGAIVAGKTLAAAFGINSELFSLVVGAGLIAAAGLICWLASRPSLNLRMARVIATLNALSALGLLAILLFGGFAFVSEGKWLAGTVAADLVILAVLEFYGIARATREFAAA